MLSALGLALVTLLWPECTTALVRREHLYDGAVARSLSHEQELFGSERKPIITGCLATCGIWDQTCVTECQVCVEEHACKQVAKGCDVCLQELRKAKSLSRSTKSVITDSGGVSLARDGVRTRLERAQIQALDKARELRRARGRVLKAQREAEWAEEEWKASVAKLRQAKLSLRRAKDEAAKWDLQRAKNMQDEQGKVLQHQAEISRLERSLQRAEKNLHEARAELRAAKNDKDSSFARHRVRVLENEVWQLKRQLAAQQGASERAHDDLEKKQKDANWLDRGFHSETEAAGRQVKKVVYDVRAARAMARLSRKKLVDAKDHYRQAVTASQRAERAAVHLERIAKRIPANQFAPMDPKSASDPDE